MKSFLTALIEILILLRSSNFAQHGIGGLTRDVSSLVKQATIELIKSSPAISKYFKITREKITCLLNESTMKNFSGDANTNNGLLLSSYIVDETACLPNNDLIGVLKLSQMSLTAGASPLAIYISTQYDMQFSIFNEMIDYHKKVLQDLIPNAPQSTFGLLFELDEEDYANYDNPELWIKASPLQAKPSNKIGMKFLLDEFSKAKEIPAKLKEFKIKILNMRVYADDSESFVALDDLRKGKLDGPFSFKNKNVYIGIDLSLTTDTTSISIVHYDDINNKFFSEIHCFVPADTLHQRSKIEKIDYQMMCLNKYCYACGDRIIDYAFIEEFLIKRVEFLECNVLGIGYDKFNAMSSVNRWANVGFETIEVRQISYVLSAGTKLFKESILQNRFFYVPNRLFEIQMSNARTAYDTNLNQYVNKKRSTGRIDMCVSTIIAFVLWSKQIEEGKSVYEERDFIVL